MTPSQAELHFFKPGGLGASRLKSATKKITLVSVLFVLTKPKLYQKQGSVRIYVCVFALVSKCVSVIAHV